MSGMIPVGTNREESDIMGYEDEKIAELKRKRRQEQHTDIREGVYIDSQFVRFSPRKLWDDIEMFIPEDFIEMPEEIQAMKYPSISRPQIILTSLDTRINFAFNLSEKKVTEDQVESFLLQMKELLKRTNPAVKFYQKKKEKLPHGQQVYMFDFKSYGVDEALYNMVSFSPLNDGMLQGIFNCPERCAESWQNAAWQAFQTINA